MAPTKLSQAHFCPSVASRPVGTCMRWERRAKAHRNAGVVAWASSHVGRRWSKSGSVFRRLATTRNARWRIPRMPAPAGQHATEKRRQVLAWFAGCDQRALGQLKSRNRGFRRRLRTDEQTVVDRAPCTESISGNDKATIGVDGLDRSREQDYVVGLGAVWLVAKSDLTDIVDLPRKPAIPSRRRPDTTACREVFGQRIGELDYLDGVSSQRYSEDSRRHAIHSSSFFGCKRPLTRSAPRTSSKRWLGPQAAAGPAFNFRATRSSVMKTTNPAHNQGTSHAFRQTKYPHSSASQIPVIATDGGRVERSLGLGDLGLSVGLSAYPARQCEASTSAEYGCPQKERVSRPKDDQCNTREHQSNKRNQGGLQDFRARRNHELQERTSTGRQLGHLWDETWQRPLARALCASAPAGPGPSSPAAVHRAPAP